MNERERQLRKQDLATAMEPSKVLRTRRIVREVLAIAEHLALDNAKDRAELERMLVEALT